MAIEQLNWSLFKYVDNQGQEWNMRGEKEGVRQAVDGSAAPGAFPNWGRSTVRRRPRSITYEDLTTHRTKTVKFYTAAAFAAVTLGSDTLTFVIPGSATGIVYTASKQNSERLPKATAGGNLAEHA